MRMFCAFQARHYRMAETLALMLCCAGREIKAAAGVILHQLAAIYNIAGNQRQARLLAKAAIEADPRREGLIRSDPQFPPDFVEKALR
ncbi:hypothetical protein OJ996_15465 [Luteolibacter sp. GHJ8]|uniref:Tetratricopeptide repeat protein n=1 Tax=Luteolibacter rhizosphaerae TaxID=2989719 RepID=A0ABT3G644_9BACT|nr:hypothetical protein [Luteolibacter rhizosphaerae]MCW1914986.1 hypothetical protein [Luteolibacter rhizosphaerae]